MSRNGKPTSEFSSETPLPKGWCWTTVGEVGEVRLGRQKSPKNRSATYPTKYLRAANLTWNGLDLSDVLEMDFKPDELASYQLMPGDVLLSEASGSAGEVGKPAIWNGEIENCCFQNTVIRFRPKAVSSKFAFTTFLHFARNGIISRVAKGVGIHHLGADRFSQIPMPLAPLNEQHRIVAKIEELFSDLDAGVVALERAKANLKRYRAAVLKAAVEGKVTAEWRAKNPKIEPASILLERILVERRKKWEADQLVKFAEAGKEPQKNWKAKYVEPSLPDTTDLPKLPKEWCWAAAEQLTYPGRPIIYGIIKPGPDTPGGVPYVRVMEMKTGTIDVGSLKRCHPQRAKLFNRATLAPGDILISKDGTIGKVALVPPELKGGNITQHLLRLSPASHLDGNYIARAIEAPVCQRWMKRETKGVALQGVNVEDFRVMPVPLPPLVEQTQIAVELSEELSQMDSAEIAIDHGLLRAALLRRSILKRGLEGSLISQDPNDESAKGLLERIKAKYKPINNISKPIASKRKRSKQEAS